MPMPSFKEYMLSSFGPLVEASGLRGLEGKLRTKDLPLARKETQFARLKSVASAESEKLILSHGEFIIRFSCQDKAFIAVNAENLSVNEKYNLISELRQDGLMQAEFEECFFLHLRYVLQTQYRLKKEFRSTDVARDFIDITGSSYAGHEIGDLIRAFSELIVLEVPIESIYCSEDIWKVACRIASSSASMRSAIITPEIAKRLGEIALKPNIPTDNIYSAITSIHWKYVFFELYKCIETIFYLPWHFALKQNLGLSYSANQLSKVCKVHIQWRAKEDNSIQALFELCQSKVFSNYIRQNSLFRDLDATASQSTFGRRVYKIRNLLVHQQDYEDHTPLDIQNVEWEAVIIFMCDVVDDLYSRFQSELSP